jgi:hypothetical protein
MRKEYRNNDVIENEAHMILAVEDDETLMCLWYPMGSKASEVQDGRSQVDDTYSR